MTISKPNYYIMTLLMTIMTGCGDSDPMTPSIESSNSDTSTPVPAYSYQVPVESSDGWAVSHIDDANIDGEALTAVMQKINNGTYVKIDSMLIVRHGVLVFEEQLRTSFDQYDPFIANDNLSVHSMQSVSKSVVSAIVGIALDRGDIASLNQSFYSFFQQYDEYDNWDESKERITLKNVLTMRHGWKWDEWTYPISDSRNSLGEIYRQSPDRVRGLLDLPMATEPGTTFAYSTIASIALGAAVENQTGIQLEDYAQQYLFEPIGITSARWGKTPVGRAHTGGGLFMSSRDMAKFGQLFLNKGTWNGQVIISESWINDSTANHVYLGYSHSDYYGYQWWSKSFVLRDGRTIDTYAAHGNGGQFIYIVPELDSVLVFTGANYGDQKMHQITNILRDYLLPAIQ